MQRARVLSRDMTQLWRIVVGILAAGLLIGGIVPSAHGAPERDSQDEPRRQCPSSARPEGFPTEQAAQRAAVETRSFCITPGYGEVPSNDADAPVPLNASSATLTSQQNWTGMAGTIKTTDPGVTHPQPCCSYEFVSTSLFAYGNDGDKWLEVGWVESDGFNPTTGSSQQMFTFDKHGGGWQLHYTVTPGNYYSYKIDKCTSEGTVRYCAYTYLSNGTWGLLRTSSATSGCTLSNGCTMNHILVEAQSTDSTPTPTLGGKINFNGFWLLKGTASYQWNTNIGTNATADPVYKPCWGTKWHTGWASKDAC